MTETPDSWEDVAQPDSITCIFKRKGHAWDLPLGNFKPGLSPAEARQLSVDLPQDRIRWIGRNPQGHEDLVDFIKGSK